MAVAKLNYLSEEQVKEIADPILSRVLANYGFRRSEIEEMEDFDGSTVFRLTAHVEKSVPAKILIDASEEMHAALRKQGEDRFVLLGTELPRSNKEEIDEDVE